MRPGDRITIAPIYGWGWSDERGSIDVPPPFMAEVLEAGRSSTVLRVTSQRHKLDGKFVHLTARTAGPDPFYNVLAYGEPVDLEYDPTRRPEIIGFASVEV